MPAVLATYMLQVRTNVIYQVDTRNPDNLSGIRTVFAKCENLSWRLWANETIYCDETSIPTATGPPKQTRRPRRYLPSDDVPGLSGGLDSVIDEEAVESCSDDPGLDVAQPSIRRQDSCTSNRTSGDRHIRSDDIEQMVADIIKCNDRLKAPLHELVDCCLLRFEHAEVHPTSRTGRSGSTTSEEYDDDSIDASFLDSAPQESPPTERPSSQSHPTIADREYSQSTVPLYRITSQSQKVPSPTAIPEYKKAPASRHVQPMGRQVHFALGASSDNHCYIEHESSPNVRKSQTVQQQKYADYLNASAIKSDDEDDADFDDSAIDDDDESSEWEDLNEESGMSSVDSKLDFRRIDSTTNLTQPRSLITLMIAQDQQEQRNTTGMARQSTSALCGALSTPNGPIISSKNSGDAPLIAKRGARRLPVKSINKATGSNAMPIMTTTNGISHQMMLSPKTTRRNMLATELTESLRRHLLHERSQKGATLEAVLKRRHTSHDVANLKQYPGQTLRQQPDKPFMKQDNPDDTTWSSSNDYYEKGW